MAETGKDEKPVRPIIIVKKRAHGGGHHGGAWKVAYADFVTAMMALFIVLWLINTNQKIQQAVAGYFQDPKGFEHKNTGLQGASDNFVITKDDMPKLKEEIEAALRRMANFEKLKNQVEMTVTAEGLRIELLENGKGMFFESANDVPTTNGSELLQLLAGEIGKLPNQVSIEGHTDSKPFAANKWDYSNWELSTDRANTARRIMQEHGLSARQVAQVRGFADKRLRKPDKPRDDSNRRVSVIVQYMGPGEGPPAVKAPPAGEGGPPAKPSGKTAPRPAPRKAAPAAAAPPPDAERAPTPDAERTPASAPGPTAAPAAEPLPDLTPRG